MKDSKGRRTATQREVTMDMVARLMSSHTPDDEILEKVSASVGFNYTPSMLSGDKAAINRRWREKSTDGYGDFVEEELVRLERLEEIAWAEYRRCAGERAVTQTIKSRADIGAEWLEVEKIVKEAPNSAEIRYWFDTVRNIQSERRDLLGLKAQLIKINMNQRVSEERKMYVTFDPNTAFPDPPARLSNPDTIEGEYTEREPAAQDNRVMVDAKTEEPI